MAADEFRAVRVSDRDVTDPAPADAPDTGSRAWQTIAEITGFIAAVALAVGIWVIV